MRGTPYIYRGRKYDRKDAQWVPGDEIVIGERIYDGVEVDRTDKLTLTPDGARYVATELWKLAEQIDGKQRKTSALTAIRRRISQIAAAAKRDAML